METVIYLGDGGGLGWLERKSKERPWPGRGWEGGERIKKRNEAPLDYRDSIVHTISGSSVTDVYICSVCVCVSVCSYRSALASSTRGSRIGQSSFPRGEPRKNCVIVCVCVCLGARASCGCVCGCADFGTCIGKNSKARSARVLQVYGGRATASGALARRFVQCSNIVISLAFAKSAHPSPSLSFAPSLSSSAFVYGSILRVRELAGLFILHVWEHTYTRIYTDDRLVLYRLGWGSGRGCGEKEENQAPRTSLSFSCSFLEYMSAVVCDNLSCRSARPRRLRALNRSASRRLSVAGH